MSKHFFIALLLALLFGAQTLRADEFRSVRCGEDIPKAVIKKKAKNSVVQSLENKYRKLELKNKGSWMISDDLYLIHWSICGSEYLFLVDQDKIQDAIPFPHSRKNPAYFGYCENTDLSFKNEPIIAVLENPNPLPEKKHYPLNDKTLLSVVSVWKIDQKQEKLVKIPADGFRCPRGGIYTLDGGP